MEESAEVRGAILAFYKRLSAGDVDAFDGGIAEGPGVHVIGSGPGERSDGHDDWVARYRDGIAAAGITVEPGDPQGYAQGSVGFGSDTPTFVVPDGPRLPVRATFVVEDDGGTWKMVHAHVSVGVPDEQAGG